MNKGLWENYPSKNFIVEFVSYQNITTEVTFTS